MREKITYIADDGMEFTSEYDCHEYENRSLPWDSVLFYNDCLERLPTKYDCLGICSTTRSTLGFATPPGQSRFSSICTMTGTLSHRRTTQTVRCLRGMPTRRTGTTSGSVLRT